MKRAILAASIVLVALISCSKPEPGPAVSPSATVVVSAAASTKDVLEALAERFAKQAGVKVNAGPSNGLATQILAGAPADLFLSASPEWADEVQKGGLAVESTKLLTNRLALVVPAGNPAQVRAPQDLTAASVKKIAMAGEDVPAGKYGDQALEKLDLLKTLTDEGKIVRGQDVRTALAYVERGEAEVGVVYSTDAKVAKGVESVYEFDPSMHDEIVYVLVLLKNAENNSAAREFYNFLQSPEANPVYAEAGFERLE